MFGTHSNLTQKNPMHPTIITQQPAKINTLMLLFHGVGGTPDSMQGAASRLATACPNAMIVCVAAPFACDLGVGLQWFSVQGITEENRPARIANVLPFFEREVKRWQNIAGVDAAHTTLFGFSQGAIISLAAVVELTNLAATVVSHSGRFPILPNAISPDVNIHLIHGERDEVVPFHLCKVAVERLQHLGARVTLDALPALGHQISDESLEAVVARLKETNG